MASPTKLKGRYELKEILGRGGMGMVYRAYDGVLKCDVALKTIRDAPEPTALQLFYRECEVLVALNHPNIVPILDIGEFEEEGQSKPYFVMPLLPGTTLDQLIRGSQVQLTVERSVDILTQICRGLHAAHERGLVHRDLKPGNVFVMPDYSVEIIDFGVAHIVSGATTGQKGTLLYMAPELLESKPPSVLSDIFALGVISYELLTRRRPFARPTEREIIEAILHEIPPPASDLDPAVNQAISRVVHKATAKQPWHRFSTAQEFSECLDKALRGEPIEYFDPARIQPRIQRATAAFEQGDYQFAVEIVSELEAEGHLDPDLPLLRRKIDITVRRKRIQQLIDNARTRMQGEEYPLALQKIQEVLQLEPDNAEAISLKARIESTRSERQIEGWFRLARQHMENNAFVHAREALQNVLQIRPHDSGAQGLLSDVDRREQEYLRTRLEKDKLYQDAVEDYQKGDISAAMTKLKRVLEMDRRTPDISHPERGTAYQNFYNQVRSDYDEIRNSYAEARKHLDDQSFAKALVICDRYLQKYPGHALFQALKFDIEEQQRLQLSSYIAQTDRRVEAEPDLQRKVAILSEALERFPDELHFQRMLRLVRERLDLVSAILAKARYLEERGQFGDALGQWEILRTIHARYPGLDFEVERVEKRREQQARAEAKARWVEQIDGHLRAGAYAQALQVCGHALLEYPGDGELQELQKHASQSEQRCSEAQRWLADGERSFGEGSFEQGIAALRKAHDLDARSVPIRAALVEKLVARAKSMLDVDWHAAESLIREALELEPGHAAASSVRVLLEDFRRQEFLNQSITQIRQLQAAADIRGALARLQQTLSHYPDEPRLIQLHATLKTLFLEEERIQNRRRDLNALQDLAAGLEPGSDRAKIESVLERMRAVAAQYAGQPEFQAIVQDAELRSKPAQPRAWAAGAESGAALAEPAPALPPSGLSSSEGDIAPAAPAQAEGLGATQIIGGLGAPAGPPTGSAPPPPPAPPRVEPPPALPATAPKPARQGRGGFRKPAVAVVGILMIAAIGLVTARFALREKMPGAISFEVCTTPPGATLRVDGKDAGTSPAPVRLPPGRYRIEVLKEGYRPETIAVDMTAGVAPEPLQVVLTPLPQRVELVTDFRRGKLWLDDAPAADIPSSGAVSLEAPPGRHRLRIESGGSRAEIAFVTSPDSLPAIEKPVVSGGVYAVLIAALKGRARLHSTYGPVPARVDGQEAGKAGPDGLELNSLSPGSHEITLGEGDQQWTGSLESRPAPGIVAFLSSGVRTGVLLVQVTGTEEAQVIVDGTPKGVTRGGQLRLTLPPKNYQVRVSKEGFLEPNPAQVFVESGKQAKTVFVVVPRPTVVAEAPAAPRPGALVGRVQVRTVPAAAMVTYSRAGDTAVRPASSPVLELEQGDYVFTARAPNHKPVSANISVKAGMTETVTLRLSPVRQAPAPPATRTMNAADWEQPWRQEGEWFTRMGGNFVLYRVTPVTGTFQFTVRPKETANPFARPNVRWVLGYTNDRNYVQLEIDKQSYTRAEIQDGKRTVRVNKKRHGVRAGFYGIKMVVEPSRVVIQISADNRTYAPLDEWNTDTGFAGGRFGFHLPGETQMWLAHFRFTPAP